MYEDEIPVGRAKDLRGQTFGKYTVLCRVPNIGNTTRWKCRCECGAEVNVLRPHLIKGAASQCRACYGKTQINNLQDKRFGKLLVLHKTDKKKDRHIIWKCKCDCGTFIDVSSHHLVHGSVQSCGCLKSKGELVIKKLFDKNNMSYETQKTFDSCRFVSGNFGRFDFYVENSYLIEYDGQQHFESVDFWGGEEEFRTLQKRDAYKTQWCKDNNIPLIRIPYTKLDTLCIEDLKLETTQFRVV